MKALKINTRNKTNHHVHLVLSEHRTANSFQKKAFVFVCVCVKQNCGNKIIINATTRTEIKRRRMDKIISQKIWSFEVEWPIEIRHWHIHKHSALYAYVCLCVCVWEWVQITDLDGAKMLILLSRFVRIFFVYVSTNTHQHKLYHSIWFVRMPIEAISNNLCVCCKKTTMRTETKQYNDNNKKTNVFGGSFTL